MIRVKTPAQIEMIRRAGHVVALVHEAMAAMVAPGVTTLDLDRRAEEVIRSHGGIPTFKGYHGYPASICASINAEVVHGIPSAKRVLQDGDIISVDVGVTLDGFIGDAARTLPVGTIDDRRKDLIRVAEECLQVALDLVAPGVRLNEVSKAIQQHAEAKGFGLVREYGGHGVGIQLHEEPHIPNVDTPGKNPRIKKGWVIAIEPMLTLGHFAVHELADGWTVVTDDGQPASHAEHTIAVTETGCDILTI